MTRATVRSWVPFATALLAALVVAGWLAPTRAQASCGDYVSVGLHHGSPGMPPVPAFQPGAPDEPVRHAWPRSSPCQQCPQEPGAPNRPCEGPWCSSSHSPLSVPELPIESPREDSAVGWSLPRLGAMAPVPLAWLHDQATRVHHVFPIFHPPRFA